MRADPTRITNSNEKVRLTANKEGTSQGMTNLLLFAIFARLGDLILEVGALSDLIETPGIKDELLERQRKLKEETDG